jgi:hypothetical protein
MTVMAPDQKFWSMLTVSPVGSKVGAFTARGLLNSIAKMDESTVNLSAMPRCVKWGVSAGYNP